MNAVLPLQQQNDFRTVVYEGRDYALTPPKVYQPVSGTSVIPETMRTNDTIVTCNHHAQLWFNGIQTLLLDAFGHHVFKYGNIDKTWLKQDKPIHLPGTSLFLGAAGAHCYYHWMVDVLPKLKAIQQTGIDLQSIDHFIIRDFKLEFQKKTLEQLGIPAEKIFTTVPTSQTRTPHIISDKLFHVEIRNFVGMKMNHFIPAFLHETFFDPNNNTDFGDKVFISRPVGVNRSLENQDQLHALLESHGYNIVIMEGLSISDQASVFNRAKTIITTHGGALTNLVFCKPGTKIVELFGTHVFSYYYGLSNLCELDYNAILLDNNSYDLVVDPYKGNAKSNQNTTIKQNFGANIQAIKALLNMN